jgi:hypothetical protein
VKRNRKEENVMEVKARPEVYEEGTTKRGDEGRKRGRGRT